MKDDYAEIIRSAPRLAVGLKQVLYGLGTGSCRTVILASDSDREFRARVNTAAALAGARVIDAPSKNELGGLAGIQVAAGVLGVLE